MKLCIVVPHYNHEAAFKAFLPILSELDLPCIIVDDGSSESSINELTKLFEQLQEQTKVDHYFYQHAQNRGKGAAVITAATHARALGFSHMIQIDADGQHDVNDVEKFMALSQEYPEAIVSGHPQFDETAPKARLYGRKVTDFWVAVETLSFEIKDSLCGFRLYPLTQFEQICDRHHIGRRMDFDTDIAVKSVWAGIPMKFVSTKVIYHQNSVSHFYYLRDNLLLIKLHVGLMLGMLIRSPWLIARKFKR